MADDYQLIDHRLAPLWRDPQMFGLSLLALFLDQYGTEGLAWTPEAVEMEVRDDTGVDLPRGNYDRLLTAASLLTDNSFFHSVPDFTRACVVLSGHTPHPDSLLLPDCADLAWGVTEALLVSPPDPDDPSPFGAEVTGYIGKCLDDEGIQNPPDVLRLGTRDRDLADRVRYNFSDDPDMFAAVQGFEADKTDTINALVKGRMRALLLQLHTLPVAGGKAAALAAQLLARLPRGDDPLPLPV